jgi:hypothetical protein
MSSDLFVTSQILETYISAPLPLLYRFLLLTDIFKPFWNQRKLLIKAVCEILI